MGLAIFLFFSVCQRELKKHSHLDHPVEITAKLEDLNKEDLKKQMDEIQDQIKELEKKYEDLGKRQKSKEAEEKDLSERFNRIDPLLTEMMRTMLLKLEEKKEKLENDREEAEDRKKKAENQKRKKHQKGGDGDKMPATLVGAMVEITLLSLFLDATYNNIFGRRLRGGQKFTSSFCLNIFNPRRS